MNCYGTQKHLKHPDCTTCELKYACGEAQYKSGHVAEFNEENGSTLFVDPYESMGIDIDQPFHHEVDPSKASSPKEEGPQECAYHIRRFFTEAIRLCNAHPVRVFILAAKMGGLTLREIGETCGMSKQAIHKHCVKMCEESPDIKRFFKMQFSNDEEISQSSKKNRYKLRQNDGRRNCV